MSHVSSNRVHEGYWFLYALVGLLTTGATVADPFPPDWNGGTGPAVHFAPAPWPSEPADPVNCGQSCGEWVPYTRFNNGVGDPRVQDPSNGGTSPQNYVNIASSCIDKDLPSIYYNLYKGATPAEDVLMFRWRVEQIANTYATGPNPGNFSATDPWSSALWTVLFDIDGDGFRDLAAHLDGSSGSPSGSIDRIAGIWGDIPTQSVDYSDPNIYLIAHNPTGFTSGNTLLNFHETGVPDTNWPNGSTEETWDYGTTRSKKIVAAPCNEYFVDYQIPIAMLDASPFGGPKLDRDTPLSMLFCTANSLNNPFQKDCALDKTWAADPERPGPYGDFCTFNEGCFEQPIIDGIEAEGCGPVNLNATVKDALAVVDGEVVPSIQAVDFYFYHDVNGNGLADDTGSVWTLAAVGTNASTNRWDATWDSTGLLQGQYLIGVQALDDPTLVDDGMPPAPFANRTFSYLDQTQVDALGNVPASSGELWWANPDVTGIKTVELALNGCGMEPPNVTKTADVSTVTAGGQVEFTISVNNTLSTAITVSEVTDSLPAGFTYTATTGGTLSPSVSPTAGATGNIVWGFAPAVSIPASTSATLVFTADAPLQAGTYTNLADATTSFGTLGSEPVEISVGEPRLTIAKSASSNSVNPGALVTYTVTYSNDSPVGVTGVVITDTLPAGLTYVAASASNGGSEAAGTITWNLGNLVPGEGPYSVTFQATVDAPYPATATIPLVNTATIDSNETAPAQASVSIFVNAPRPSLTLQKSANKASLDPAAASPGNQVVYTLSYANVGNAEATGVVLTDTIPPGFSFVSATGGGGHLAGVVTWNLGTLAPAASGSVTVTLQVADPYTDANPSVNTAQITSNETVPVTATGEVGIKQTGQACNNYYLTDTQEDIGFDGLQRVANTVVPSGAPNVIQQYVPENATQVIAQFYQDPVSDYTIDFGVGASRLGGQIYYTKSAALGGTVNANLTLTAKIYDYNPADGATVLLGSASYADNGTPTPPVDLTAAAVTGQLLKGHRLLVAIEVAMGTNKHTTMALSVDNPGSFVEVCSAPPPNLVLNKRVDQVSAVAGDTLTYTIDYANTGASDATGVVLSDTLPTGVTFASSSPAPSASAPPLYTFDLGTVAAGASGSVSIGVDVENPLDGAITELRNIATITSNETPEVTATATTGIEGSGSSGPPVLVISKSANLTRIGIGDTVTYTITVLNAGGSTATAIHVTDDIPDRAYFPYIDNSITGGDARATSGTPVDSLSWDINSLAVGASVTLTFQMQVQAGAPGGSTVLDNLAGVTSNETPSTDSNIVAVTIDTNPALALTKTVTPAGTVGPGDTLSYELVVTNNGDAMATDVRVVDPFPANSVFVRGSQTTTQGTASFDPVGERVVFQVGSLASGTSATLTFQVRVLEPLPHGSTPIDNTANATASNAPSVQASAGNTANAAAALYIDKTGPTDVAFPAAALAADAATSTLVYVDDAVLLKIGATVSIAGQIRNIVSIAGNAVTLNAPVTAAGGDTVVQAIRYGISYGNSGNADATGVVLSDTLPANMAYVSAVPPPSSAPAVGTSGTLSWNLGTLAAGQTASAQILALPIAPGLATNNASITCAETSPQNDSVDTGVGGLRVHKYTTTPVVAQTPTGTSATYVIQVFNNLPGSAGPVGIEDVLTAGFTYASTTSVTVNGVPVIPSGSPTAGDIQPVWSGLTIPPGGTLEIRFVADIAPSVGPATYQNEVTGAADESVTQFDFLATTVEDVTVLASGSGQIDGLVYQDNDGSGDFSTGDVPLGGVDVTITASDNTVYVATTNAAGYFSRVVPSGSTVVDVDDTDLPPGVSLTIDTNNEGTDATTVNVPDGGSARDNTGYVYAGPSGAIAGTVFDDLDGDGTQDVGEPGIAGVTVALFDAAGGTTPIATTVTSSTGDYSFPGVPVGTSYRVVETDPLGYVSTTTNDVANVAVTDGGITTVNFGDQQRVTPTGSITGVVYDDVNASTYRDGGEPSMGGVTVQLRDSGGALVATTSTLPDGTFVFDNLPPGSYTLAEIDPSGYVSTTANHVPVTVVGGVSSVVDFGDRLAIASNAASIPTLSLWGIAALSVLLGGLGARRRV